ncbi:MAG: DNA recombination/repair protein RecA [bacterium]|nr:DNA recombination/repair protein RecA [bacterium]
MSKLDEKFEEDIKKILGAQALEPFSKRKIQCVQRISTGIGVLDDALGGGIPKGRIIEIYGEENCGKSWILFKIYAAYQKQKLSVYHFDLENAFDPVWARSQGIDLNKFAMSDNVTYAENMLGAVDILCKSGRYDVIGIDSTTALIPKAELEGEYDAQHMAQLARIMSQTLKKISKSAGDSGTSVIFINQIREKVGVFFGNNETTPGGRALKFYSSIRIEAKKRLCKQQDRPDLWENSIPIGHVLKCKIVKNKTAPPFRVAEIDLFYKTKNKMTESVERAIGNGIIKCLQKNQKKFEYGGKTLTINQGGNWDELVVALQKGDLLVRFLDDMDEDLNYYIDLGMITKEQVDSYTRTS